jgi:uncharacterized SAM-binding protein YcdF (DUF218 family)
VIKFALTQFLVPPGLLVALLLFAARRLQRAGKGGAAACAGFALLLWACSLAPLGDRLLERLEGGLSIPANPRGDVIVVLGGGLDEGVPDLSGVGAPTDDTMARIVTGVRLQRKLKLQVIVSGGTLVPGRALEAPVMKRFLVNLGVPPEKVTVESDSRDTLGNAASVRKLMEAKGYRRALLVTSAYHMRRAAFLFEKKGVAVIPFPAQFRTHPGRTYVWQECLPSASAMRCIAAACKEFLGIAWYRITLGAPDLPGAGKDAI